MIWTSYGWGFLKILNIREIFGNGETSFGIWWFERSRRMLWFILTVDDIYYFLLQSQFKCLSQGVWPSHFDCWSKFFISTTYKTKNKIYFRKSCFLVNIKDLISSNFSWYLTMISSCINLLNSSTMSTLVNPPNLLHNSSTNIFHSNIWESFVNPWN